MAGPPAPVPLPVGPAFIEPPAADPTGRYRPVPTTTRRRWKYTLSLLGAFALVIGTPIALNAALPGSGGSYSNAADAFSQNILTYESWPVSFTELDRCRASHAQEQPGRLRFTCNRYSVEFVGLDGVTDQAVGVQRSLRALYPFMKFPANRENSRAVTSRAADRIDADWVRSAGPFELIDVFSGPPSSSGGTGSSSNDRGTAGDGTPDPRLPNLPDMPGQRFPGLGGNDVEQVSQRGGDFRTATYLPAASQHAASPRQTWATYWSFWREGEDRDGKGTMLTMIVASEDRDVSLASATKLAESGQLEEE